MKFFKSWCVFGFQLKIHTVTTTKEFSDVIFGDLTVQISDLIPLSHLCRHVSHVKVDCHVERFLFDSSKFACLRWGSMIYVQVVFVYKNIHQWWKVRKLLHDNCIQTFNFGLQCHLPNPFSRYAVPEKGPRACVDCPSTPICISLESPIAFWHDQFERTFSQIYIMLTINLILSLRINIIVGKFWIDFTFLKWV